MHDLKITLRMRKWR